MEWEWGLAAVLLLAIAGNYLLFLIAWHDVSIDGNSGKASGVPIGPKNRGSSQRVRGKAGGARSAENM